MTTKTRYITFMPSGRSRSRSMCGLLAVAVCGLLGALTAPPARAQPTCTPPNPHCEALLSTAPNCDGVKSLGGDPDDFCLSGVPDPAPVACNIPSIPGPFVPFDNPTINGIFCHSFGVKNSPGAAILEIRLKALGSSLNFNDSINLYNAAGTFLWGRRIGSDGSTIPPLTGLLGLPWSGGDTHSFCLNLSALPNEPNSPLGPTTNIIGPFSVPAIGGTLQVLVQDDTSVDYAILFESQCEKIVPAVSAWALGALALLLLSGVAIKFGRRRAA